MENSELKRPSKKVRLVLAILVVTAVSAIAPASGFAAHWTSIVETAHWTS